MWLSLIKIPQYTGLLTIDKMHSFKSFAEFCQDTSLHGWAHFNQSRNSKVARFVWFLIIMASFGVAIFLNGMYTRPHSFLKKLVCLHLNCKLLSRLVRFLSCEGAKTQLEKYLLCPREILSVCSQIEH